MSAFAQDPAANDASRAFVPGDIDSYRSYRDRKVREYPRRPEDLLVEIKDPFALTAPEKSALGESLRRANMAVYVLSPAFAGRADPRIPEALGLAFGLSRLDHNPLAEEGITHLEYRDADPEATYSPADYIPYTRRALSWHTDGYYNAPDRQVRAVLLHCVRPASRGGENQLLDHEIAYMLLRDENPEYIDALSRPDAMTIPANVSASGEILRAATSGPVFSVREDGRLHMRYSARKRYISWSEQARPAAKRLEEILSGETELILNLRLEAGQGLLSNNVLHNRTAFEDAGGDRGRLLYRARYYDRAGI